jgi:hypothetical protein
LQEIPAGLGKLGALATFEKQSQEESKISLLIFFRLSQRSARGRGEETRRSASNRKQFQC